MAHKHPEHLINNIDYETNSKQNPKGKNDYCSPGKKSTSETSKQLQSMRQNKYHDITNSICSDADSPQ
jgi:hypothetical protein